MRTVLIIDAAYANSVQKESGHEIDFMKLKRKICELNGGDLSDVYYLTTVPDAYDPDLEAFLNWLRQADPHGPKMRVQIYRMKSMQCKCPGCGQEFRRPVQKGVDVGIATLIIRLCGHYERLILMGGDGDFADAIEYIRDQHREFWLLGQYGTVAAELQSFANQVIWMDAGLWNSISKSRSAGSRPRKPAVESPVSRPSAGVASVPARTPASGAVRRPQSLSPSPLALPSRQDIPRPSAGSPRRPQESVQPPPARPQAGPGTAAPQIRPPLAPSRSQPGRRPPSGPVNPPSRQR